MTRRAVKAKASTSKKVSTMSKGDPTRPVPTRVHPVSTKPKLMSGFDDTDKHGNGVEIVHGDSFD